MIPSVIACDIHDHVEIICLRRYKVILQIPCLAFTFQMIEDQVQSADAYLS